MKLREGKVTVNYRSYEGAIDLDRRGVPVLDRQRLAADPAKIVSRELPAVVLENDHFRATLIPQQGRLHSFINQQTGHEELWINPVAVPLGANNDTQFWMTWGGIEHVLPRGEHGTSHALVWDYTVLREDDDQKSVRMTVTEPLTGLQQSLVYTARADVPFLETLVTVENPTEQPVRFSHWTTALYAPGPKDEVTPRTEIVVPAEQFVPDQRAFNDWMRPLAGPTDQSALRFVGRWSNIGDLMTSPLSAPYYAVYCHEAQEGIVRTFDAKRTPGFDIWSWGYPVSMDRQREFTAGGPNQGYIEIWNGTSRGFADADLGEITPGEVIAWRETLFCITGIEAEDQLRSEVRRRAEEVLKAVGADPQE